MICRSKTASNAGCGNLYPQKSAVSKAPPPPCYLNGGQLSTNDDGHWLIAVLNVRANHMEKDDSFDLLLSDNCCFDKEAISPPEETHTCCYFWTYLFIYFSARRRTNRVAIL